jgi:hypothetical protein
LQIRILKKPIPARDDIPKLYLPFNISSQHMAIGSIAVIKENDLVSIFKHHGKPGSSVSILVVSGYRGSTPAEAKGFLL